VSWKVNALDLLLVLNINEVVNCNLFRKIKFISKFFLSKDVVNEVKNCKRPFPIGSLVKEFPS